MRGECLLKIKIRQKYIAKNTYAHFSLSSFRNHAKEIFRRLTRCEGFRKALAESVPETTLRHIEKTLKSL